MANPRGAVLTERDRALLSYVAIARYASAEQVHALFFDGSSRKQTYRRLAKLCAPGNRPGQDACLRRLEYRRRDGTAVPVWALTGYGRGLAEELVPYLRPPAAHDVGHRFLQHTLLLNDVLAGLVRRLRPTPAAPLASLPFRWLAEDDGVLELETWDPKHPLDRHRAVLKPDAILEMPARRRRVFLEAETGTQSIATKNPARTGAILAKLERYRAYFLESPRSAATMDTRSWYRHAFPDEYAPRLAFIVHSRERKQRVMAAAGGAMRKLAAKEPRGLPFDVFVLTFAEAASVLAHYVAEGRLASTGVHGTPRTITVESGRVDELRRALAAVVDAVNGTMRVVHAHNVNPVAKPLAVPPLRDEPFRVLREFIERELAGSARPAAEPRRTAS